ncbi:MULTISPECIES: adenylyltransferase/cytidyltransferase family protein [Helicobacter]|uniref:Glycerol-3-phosphate cytidylyltransferase n=2 Tax=Helicobacter typhlonius TaxID=76936 RepID=A0A099UE52_9HELI|nr:MULTISPECIES: adenylyltransferase/cytidyltransferase family protein [Helicobacter]TLD79276.1 glycerol-3-phosphate cytidylyltransferase [Helicobacter typhlonius]TLD86000.1 glycerol-3-phosphate cytidylyltransferase [Helicobacter sp. MIT 03-1616]CUU40638.1 Glycerol-3-phosphate cytidylyltransferase [Helicobacter typhlonius]HCD73704.1 glycerol-3-phosphate cytidylyltransferase [Helicobacter sp.]
MIVGYTTGVYDLFHIGHLNLLRNAKSMCDKLIVGITTDELVGYKNKKAVIPFHERMEIVRNIRFVDAVIPQENMDKLAMHDKLKFDIMFVGDDWFATPKWQKIDEEFAKRGVRIVYFPYTQGTSSTLLNNVLLSLRQEAEQNQ